MMKDFILSSIFFILLMIIIFILPINNQIKGFFVFIFDIGYIYYLINKILAEEKDV